MVNQLANAHRAQIFSIKRRSPGASFADSLGSFEVRRAASLDFRGLAGRNVVVVAMEGFVENLLCLLEMRLAPILDIIRKNAKHASLKAVDASRECPHTLRLSYLTWKLRALCLVLRRRRPARLLSLKPLPTL
jgi:hypothetical protein